MGAYMDELTRAMNYLGQQQNTLFIGQSVEVAGTAMRNTLLDIAADKLLELPVEEDFQAGISIGMALNGYVPVTCYPRFDFLICAMNQLVNHLDKIRQMSCGELKPKVIIRTSIGSKVPLNGGPQHTQDYTLELKTILKEVKVIFLNKPEIIFSSFKKAYEDKESHSYLFVEHGDFYNDK